MLGIYFHWQGSTILLREKIKGVAKKISKKTGGGVEIMGYWQNYVQKMAFTGKKHAEMPVTDIIFRTRHTRISLSVMVTLV